MFPSQRPGFHKIVRELSFLMLGTRVEEFLEVYQIFLPCDIGLPNNLAISCWGIKNFCQESFDTGLVKKLGKFPYWDKKPSCEKKTCIPKYWHICVPETRKAAPMWFLDSCLLFFFPFLHIKIVILTPSIVYQH